MPPFVSSIDLTTMFPPESPLEMAVSPRTAKAAMHATAAAAMFLTLMPRIIPQKSHLTIAFTLLDELRYFVQSMDRPRSMYCPPTFWTTFTAITLSPSFTAAANFSTGTANGLQPML